MKNRKLFNACMAGILGAAMLMTSVPAMAAEFSDDAAGEGITVEAQIDEEMAEEEAEPFSDELRAAKGTPIEKAYFPDTPFRAYVLKEIDVNKDRILSSTEVQATKEINVSGKKIKSLKGIEKFTYLEELNASGNYLTSVDLSKNTKLAYINVGKNKLKTLDLRYNTRMETLVCSNNYLTRIYMPSYKYLTKMDYMDVSHNKFTSQSYAGLSYISASKMKSLSEVNASYNYITSFNCSGFEGILDISNNKITTLTDGAEGYQATAIYVEGKYNTLSKTSKVDFASLGNRVPQQFSCNDSVRSKVVMVKPRVSARLDSDWKKVDLGVGSSSDFASYKLERRIGSGSYKTLKTWGEGELDDPEFGDDGFTDTTVTPGNTYVYRLTSYVKVNDRNRRPVTWYNREYATVKTLPGTASISVKSSKTGTATISMKASGASGYRVYMGTSSSKVSTIVNSGTTSTSYTKTKLKSGRTYYFRVRPYRVVDGKRVYGDLSSVKGVKIR